MRLSIAGKRLHPLKIPDSRARKKKGREASGSTTRSEDVAARKRRRRIESARFFTDDTIRFRPMDSES